MKTPLSTGRVRARRRRAGYSAFRVGELRTRRIPRHPFPRGRSSAGRRGSHQDVLDEHQLGRAGSLRRDEEGRLLPLSLGGRYRDSGVRVWLWRPGNGHAARRRQEAQRPRQPEDWTDWEPSEPLTSGSTTASPTARPEPTDISVPSDPTRPSRCAILLAAEMATDCIDEFSKKTRAASKMTMGSTPVPEMITLGTELAARLATYRGDFSSVCASSRG